MCVAPHKAGRSLWNVFAASAPGLSLLLAQEKDFKELINDIHEACTEQVGAGASVHQAEQQQEHVW